MCAGATYMRPFDLWMLAICCSTEMFSRAFCETFSIDPEWPSHTIFSFLRLSSSPICQSISKSQSINRLIRKSQVISQSIAKSQAIHQSNQNRQWRAIKKSHSRRVNHSITVNQYKNRLILTATSKYVPLFYVRVTLMTLDINKLCFHVIWHHRAMFPLQLPPLTILPICVSSPEPKISVRLAARFLSVLPMEPPGANTLSWSRFSAIARSRVPIHLGSSKPGGRWWRHD